MLKTKEERGKENELKNSFYLYNGLGYVWVGVQHFVDTSFFKIMPPSFPCKNLYMLVILKYYLDAELFVKNTLLYEQYCY